VTKSSTIIPTLLFLATSLHAQLAAPNELGVAMGHLHLNTADVTAQKKLWAGILGAKLVKLGTMEGVSMSGAVILFKAAAPTGPTVGSTVNHVGVLVPSLAPFPAKLDAAGLKYTTNADRHQIMIDAPDGLKLELTADPSVTEPIRFHHIHFYTADPLAIQAWYAKTFGAKPGKRAQWEAGDLPGANLTFAKASGPVAPTMNRALDHIGFEVRDLEAFCKKLEASGVKFDSPYRKLPQLGLALAFLTDPWGTRIELTEGLGKL
jgi:catechol 2,3-dioxygenase-like lactoylglutathione lyase family enzyme